MGCNYYTLKCKPDAIIKFDEMGDGCLCGFPHDHEETLTPDIVEKLAQLGACIAMVSSGEIEDGYVPGSLPEWIRDEISRVVHRGKRPTVREVREAREFLKNRKIESSEEF